MPEIEVGEYGRTNLGNIFIFAWLENADGIKYEDKVILIKNNKVINEFYYFKGNEKIVKHSKNIIDLIEVGDYVNGYEVLDKYLFNGEKPVLETNGEETNCKCLCDLDIRTIVTKEQFEQVQYKVGD